MAIGPEVSDALDAMPLVTSSDSSTRPSDASHDPSPAAPTAPSPQLHEHPEPVCPVHRRRRRDTRGHQYRAPELRQEHGRHPATGARREARGERHRPGFPLDQPDARDLGVKEFQVRDGAVILSTKGVYCGSEDMVALIRPDKRIDMLPWSEVVSAGYKTDNDPTSLMPWRARQDLPELLA